MSAEVDRLKERRHARVRELVQEGLTATEAWDRVADLTSQIAAQRAEDALVARVSADLEAGKVVEFTVGTPLTADRITLPAPVPATSHAMFHESTRFPGVVWPL